MAAVSVAETEPLHSVAALVVEWVVVEGVVESASVVQATPEGTVLVVEALADAAGLVVAAGDRLAYLVNPTGCNQKFANNEQVRKKIVGQVWGSPPIMLKL